MERCAMFIDAGYLLAEAGDLLFDTLNRTGKKSRDPPATATIKSCYLDLKS